MCIATLSSLGQQPQIIYLDLIPNEPTTDTEVKLALGLGTWDTSPYQGSTIEYGTDTVWVNSCNVQSQSPSPQAHHDTLTLGYFSAGDYVIDYTASLTSNSETCEPFESQDSLLYFTVAEPLGLYETNGLQNIRIWPNPNADGTIRIVNLKDYSFKRIITHTGTVIKEFSKVESVSEHINVNDLPNGLYFLELESSSGNIVLKKFVKI